MCLWLQAFIHGPLSHAGAAEMRRLQEAVAELLAPMLDIITAMPTVQVDTASASSTRPEPGGLGLCQGTRERHQAHRVWQVYAAMAHPVGHFPECCSFL